MRKRFIFGAGLVLFAILLTLMVWQGSFTFGGYGPSNIEETYLFWAVSTLVFILTVTLGFMLFRTGVKLYIERQSNREGSRIRSKLVVGALALSILPVCFLVLFSISVLNRNIEKWFSRPGENIKLSLVDAGKAFDAQLREKAQAQANWLALLPETQAALANGTQGPATDKNAAFFNPICRDNNIDRLSVKRSDGSVVSLCSTGTLKKNGSAARAPVSASGGIQGELVLNPRMGVDLAAKQSEINKYVADYDQLGVKKKETRSLYLLLLVLITLFILFVATWIALILARQISVPISALLDAAGEVRKGNLSHRVHVIAIDELATLVKAFNEMTEGLEGNSRELERRRRFTEAILENIPTGVISLAADGRIQKVNRALKSIFPEQQIERANRLEDLFTREDAAEIRYLTKRARRTGVAASQLEFASDRKVLHLAVTVSALEERGSSGFVLVLEDMSDLLRAQKAAAWNEVARRIAHEIKNPLTPIALCAERISRQLQRNQLHNELQRILCECSATILQEVETLKTLVDEFSEFARFPAAQPAPCDLNDVVESAMGVFAGRLDGIEVRMNLAPRLPLVNIDREQFKRLVVNLVDNAAEAMQDSLIKALYVGTQNTIAETVELTIADTGCGVSVEDKEKLFLPYFSTKGRGTGLGLAIVNSILSDHHAKIRVEDNVPAGARFIIEIAALGENDAEILPADSRPGVNRVESRA